MVWPYALAPSHIHTPSYDVEVDVSSFAVALAMGEADVVVNALCSPEAMRDDESEIEQTIESSGQQVCTCGYVFVPDRDDTSTFCRVCRKQKPSESEAEVARLRKELETLKAQHAEQMAAELKTREQVVGTLKAAMNDFVLTATDQTTKLLNMKHTFQGQLKKVAFQRTVLGFVTWHMSTASLHPGQGQSEDPMR